MKHSSFKLSDHQISTSLSGESVVLNHKKGIYYGLNEVGTFLWNTLEERKCVSFFELRDLILENFEIDQETCELDLLNLLNELIDEKLVDQVD